MKPRTGPEVAQSNRNIRKLMRLAKASKKDVFYDLGCGRGQLCIIAVTEFGVRKAVGIESHRGRLRKARDRIRRLGLSQRIEIVGKDIYDSDLGDATIVYNGLMEDDSDLAFYEEILKPGCRLVTLSLPLVGVIPNDQDYPFYVMKMPFSKTRSMSDWIRSVLSKESSFGEFIKEIDDDPDYSHDKPTLRRLTRNRFDLVTFP